MKNMYFLSPTFFIWVNHKFIIMLMEMVLNITRYLKIYVFFGFKEGGASHIPSLTEAYINRN